MFRGCRRFVSLALCVCFTLSMLFLNTLDVKAGYNNFNWGYSFTDFQFGSQSVYVRQLTGSVGTTSGVMSGVFGAAVISGSSAYIEVPFNLVIKQSDVPDTTILPNSYYSVGLGAFEITPTNLDSVSDVGLYCGDTLIAVPYSTSLKPSYQFWNSRFLLNSSSYWGIGEQYAYLSIPCTLKCKVNWESYNQGSQDASGKLDDISRTFSISLSSEVNFSTISASEVAASSAPVVDYSTGEKLDTQISQENTAQETRSGILSKITEFFGSFFSNLIGVFVPEDGYFASWFNRLNTLLAQKLGMLYAPFDLLIQVLTSILNADDSFAGIPFPGIEWDGQYLIEPFTFTFSSLGDVYTDLQGYVYFGTDVILLLAFFGLLQDKIRHILED